MKSFLLFFVLNTLWYLNSFAQQATVKYTYDASGNRVTRNTTTVSNAAVWAATGNTRCAVDENNQNTGTQQREEKDNNTSSSTYNQLRWVNIGMNISACPAPALWIATGNYRCQTDGSNLTGYTEEEQIDNNPGSPTYNQIQWVTYAYDPVTCPPPCDTDCSSLGPQYACIYGQCEEGIRVCTSSWYIPGWGYENTFHYEYSDGSWSTEYTQVECCACF